MRTLKSRNVVEIREIKKVIGDRHDDAAACFAFLSVMSKHTCEQVCIEVSVVLVICLKLYLEEKSPRSIIPKAVSTRKYSCNSYSGADRHQ